MRVLLLGSGGREHALAWKLVQSPDCNALFIAPGNPGTGSLGTNVALDLNDFESVYQFCQTESVDMVIVGPEEPLVKGIVDFLRQRNKDLKVIGPSKEGAKLEGSKAYAKAFMNRHNIPTAAYAEFTSANYEEGIEYLRRQSLPIVLKADGLAAGKGVIIAETLEEAVAAFREMLIGSRFGEAGNKVVIESFLKGIELSVFVLTDGREYLILPEAKDYKRIGEGDSGLNTGGMGAVSPVPFADTAFMELVEEKVIRPTILGLSKENIDYTGFVFFGLIMVTGQPFVIEYNCRMGDPETEVVMPRLKTDLLELLVAATENSLRKVKPEFDERACCTVMAVSGGYPGDIVKGKVISGLDKIADGDSLLFHSGTAQNGEDILTNGGRVFCVSSFGTDIAAAVAKSREEIAKTGFEGMYFRKDIGYEFY